MEILTATERELVVDVWNETAVDYPPVGLMDRFDAVVMRDPNAVAVVCGDRSVTYGELQSAANRMAFWLREAGVGPDVLVGVCLGRSVELVISVLAVLKAGGAYVPLDPGAPRARLEFMVADAAMPVVVTDRASAEGLEVPSGTRVLRVDDDRDELAGLPDVGVECGAGPEHLAYVIYTSGSTGTPKGVLVPRGAVCNLFDACAELFDGFGSDDVWALFHSPSFDLSVWEMFGALLHGGRLVIVPPELLRSPGEFLTFLTREGVTRLMQTPGAFRELTTAVAENPEVAAKLDLRDVVLCGEATHAADIIAWAQAMGLDQPRLVNAYGPAEATVFVTYHRFSVEDLVETRSPSIGRPLANVRTYVLDEWGKPAPIGVPGELHIAGCQLARGYLHRPELTTERFVPDPFGDDGGRMYRTGDLARWRSDGLLEYVGRKDNQVKIRGHRIELGEIEVVLGAHDGVRSVVVVARDDMPGADRRLVAYVVGADPERPPSTSELRTFLNERLPAYMVPAHIVAVEHLPLTLNGKIDRDKLPIPTERPDVATEYVEPATATEKVLAAIWAETLGIESVGANDNFFELGGDSILSIHIVEEIEARLGEIIDVAKVLEWPTVAGVGALIDEQSARREAVISSYLNSIGKDSPGYLQAEECQSLEDGRENLR
jgi:amino acid adenylation domain-containing protein